MSAGRGPMTLNERPTFRNASGARTPRRRDRDRAPGYRGMRGQGARLAQAPRKAPRTDDGNRRAKSPMTISVHQYLCLTDNYGVLVHDSTTGATACVDVPEAGAHARSSGGAGLELNRHPGHASSRRSHSGRAGREGKIPKREGVGSGQGRVANSFPRSSGEGRGHGSTSDRSERKSSKPPAIRSVISPIISRRTRSPSAAIRCSRLVAVACSRRLLRSCGVRSPSWPPFPAKPKSTAGMNTLRRMAGSPSPSNPTIRF